MVQEWGTDNVHHVDPDCDLIGVKRIGDIIRQLIDERGWTSLRVVTQATGNRPGAKGDDLWQSDDWPDPRDHEPFGRAIGR